MRHVKTLRRALRYVCGRLLGRRTSLVRVCVCVCVRVHVCVRVEDQGTQLQLHKFDLT